MLLSNSAVHATTTNVSVREMFPCESSLGECLFDCFSPNKCEKDEENTKRNGHNGDDDSNKIKLMRNVRAAHTHFCCFCNRRFYVPARLAGAFTLNSNPVGIPWPQVSTLLPPPRACLHFYRVWDPAFPLLVGFHRFFASSRSGAFSDWHQSKRFKCKCGPVAAAPEPPLPYSQVPGQGRSCLP